MFQKIKIVCFRDLHFIIVIFHSVQIYTLCVNICEGIVMYGCYFYLCKYFSEEEKHLSFFFSLLLKCYILCLQAAYVSQQTNRYDNAGAAVTIPFLFEGIYIHGVEQCRVNVCICTHICVYMFIHYLMNIRKEGNRTVGRVLRIYYCNIVYVHRFHSLNQVLLLFYI